MPLHFLDFDFSEDAAGHGTFDAMASALPPQWPALQAEVLRVLDWAGAAFPDGPGPLDEGASWDMALQGVEEVSTPLEVRPDAARGLLALQRHGAGLARITLTLTLSGTPAFCEALREAFGLE